MSTKTGVILAFCFALAIVAAETSRSSRPRPPLAIVLGVYLVFVALFAAAILSGWVA